MNTTKITTKEQQKIVVFNNKKSTSTKNLLLKKESKQSISLNEISTSSNNNLNNNQQQHKKLTVKKSSTMLLPSSIYLNKENKQQYSKQQNWITAVGRRVSKWVSGTSFEHTISRNSNEEIIHQINPLKISHSSLRSFSMSSRYNFKILLNYKKI